MKISLMYLLSINNLRVGITPAIQIGLSGLTMILVLNLKKNKMKNE